MTQDESIMTKVLVRVIKFYIFLFQLVKLSYLNLYLIKYKLIFSYIRYRK